MDLNYSLTLSSGNLKTDSFLSDIIRESILTLDSMVHSRVSFEARHIRKLLASDRSLNTSDWINS